MAIDNKAAFSSSVFNVAAQVVSSVSISVYAVTDVVDNGTAAITAAAFSDLTLFRQVKSTERAPYVGTAT